MCVRGRTGDLLHIKVIPTNFRWLLHFGSLPRAAEAELHGFQCRLDYCSENLVLNNDLLRNTIGIQIGKCFW